MLNPEEFIPKGKYEQQQWAKGVFDVEFPLHVHRPGVPLLVT